MWFKESDDNRVLDSGKNRHFCDLEIVVRIDMCDLEIVIRIDMCDLEKVVGIDMCGLKTSDDNRVLR